MHILLYGLIALSGWALGYALGASWQTWVVAPCLALGGIGMFVISKTAHITPSGPFSVKSVAHRAWFASSWATLGAIFIVWISVGWSLPNINVPGLRLDPAGALGWTPQWLIPRQRLVMIFLGLGLVGLLWGVGSWLWQKHKGRAPVVLALWALPPFFWMATLGLLIGITQPWREVPENALAAAWKAQDRSAEELARIAIKEASENASSAVWAHALALASYEKREITRDEMGRLLSELAANNATRQQQSLLPSSGQVGLEALFLCEAEKAREGKSGKEISSGCGALKPGRAWDWPVK